MPTFSVQFLSMCYYQMYYIYYLKSLLFDFEIMPLL